MKFLVTMNIPAPDDAPWEKGFPFKSEVEFISREVLIEYLLGMLKNASESNPIVEALGLKFRYTNIIKPEYWNKLDQLSEESLNDSINITEILKYEFL